MDAVRRTLATLGAVLGVAAAAQGQLVPAGSEFQVNSYTSSFQEDGAVAVGAAGNFVVVWPSNGQDGSGRGVFGQRYSSTGAPEGTEFQVNSYTLLGQSNDFELEPSIAAHPDGAFVVVWGSDGQDGSAYGVFAQRFNSDGTPAGTEFQVNTYTLGEQGGWTGVAAAGDGSFVVVWGSYGQDGSSYGAFGQRYDSTGAPAGGEFQVNTYTPGGQGATGGLGAFADAGGNFVVVWASFGQDQGGSNGVFGQRYDSTGAPAGGEFQVNTYTKDWQTYPTIAGSTDGSFVVVWGSFQQDGSNYGVFSQRFDSAGGKAGTEFQVNTSTISIQYPWHQSVAVDASGNFAVVWTESTPVGTSGEVFGRRYDSAGAAVGLPFQINSYTTDRQNRPSVASTGSDDFVVVWQSFTQDGDGYGVFGQRFAGPSDTPTATPTDAPTGTPTDTATVTPPDTPTPTPTPTITPTSTSTATLTPSATPPGVSCPAAPSGSCSVFPKGLLKVKENVPGAEKLLAKMVTGPALSQSDFGNPLSPGGTAYALCLYDSGGALVQTIIVDRAFDLCSAGTKACWRPVGKVPPDPQGKGYQYKDDDLAAAGIAKIKLKGGAAGTSKMLFKGQGPNLPDGIPAALLTTTNVTVQLHGSDAPQCLSITLPQILKQTADMFKAKK